MSVKHTPAPWRVKGPNIISISGDALVAVVTDSYTDEPTPADEQASNARLIASAPELLNALRDLVALTKPTYENRHKLAAAIDAIERATGEEDAP